MFFLKKLFSSKKMVTRIAPSPTGLFHVGTARSALFNYLVAKKYGGEFIVRIEDTDRERSKPEYEKDILDGMEWLGLSWDALYRQSERTDIYTKYLKKLIRSGHAYISKEESKTKPGETVEVVRLKNPGEDVTFTDQIRGEITFNTAELGDFVIAKSLTEPLYHLAVVVDDFEMGVTDVIRGEDHVSNTPRQILIQRALGIKQPKYAHIPLILASDRSKLSKRKGATSITEYRKLGYLPEALVNYLALLGWNPGTEKEVYTLDELVCDFSLEQVQKGGAIFDTQKLNWFNKEHVRGLPHEKLLSLIESALPKRVKELPQYSKERLDKASKVFIERVESLSELTELAEAGEFDYFFDTPKMEAKLSWKDDPIEKSTGNLSGVLERIDVVPENTFTASSVKEAVWDFAGEQGRGSVLWPMRVALSGKDKSPDPFELSEILGKDETSKRLRDAYENRL
ncbi:MAG: glutamate--tRNA ligase [Candidatus Pacebacteria bacterium]|nr:glutamate--tRNA ligase [Candidatus Paceibacterota bacterium]